MLHETIDVMRSRCDAAGFDVVHAFRLDWFNDAVEPSLRLPDHGRQDALGVIIGNTRHLWGAFARALRSDASLLASPHPLDTYVEKALTDAVTQSLAERHEMYFAHRIIPTPIAIQRVAHESGLAHLSPSRLSLHPAYGPWWSLRAVVVVDAEGPAGDAPRAPDPCTPCSKPCLAAFDRALAVTDTNRAGDVEKNWEAWALVRDVCPEGRAFRFGDDQLRYHYTKDGAIVRLLVR